jgi:hypothetical protein
MEEIDAVSKEQQEREACCQCRERKDNAFKKELDAEVQSMKRTRCIERRKGRIGRTDRA